MKVGAKVIEEHSHCILQSRFAHLTPHTYALDFLAQNEVNIDFYDTNIHYVLSEFRRKKLSTAKRIRQFCFPRISRSVNSILPTDWI